MVGVRIALMGTGLIRREHAALVAVHLGASLAAIADPVLAALDLAIRR